MLLIFHLAFLFSLFFSSSTSSSLALSPSSFLFLFPLSLLFGPLFFSAFCSFTKSFSFPLYIHFLHLFVFSCFNSSVFLSLSNKTGWRKCVSYLSWSSSSFSSTLFFLSLFLQFLWYRHRLHFRHRSPLCVSFHLLFFSQFCPSSFITSSSL